jgi:hypothetical protein
MTVYAYHYTGFNDAKAMKTLFQILFLGLLFSACSRPESINPPEAVSNSFKNMYPAIREIRYELTPEKTYAGYFKMTDSRDKAAYFDASGKWLRTETFLEPSDLPSVMVKTVFWAYEGYKITEPLLIEKPSKEIYYRLTLKKSKKTKEVFLTRAGVILPSEP